MTVIRVLLNLNCVGDVFLTEARVLTLLFNEFKMLLEIVYTRPPVSAVHKIYNILWNRQFQKDI